MSVNETLRQVVEEAKETSDYSKIRDRLWARIATDLSLSGDFKEALYFCIKSGIREADLYEGHDGRDVDLESSEENLSSLIGALRTNFSKERLEAVRKMGGKLHPKQGSSTPSQAPDKAKSSSNSIKRYSVQKEGGSSSQEDGRSGRRRPGNCRRRRRNYCRGNLAQEIVTVIRLLLRLVGKVAAAVCRVFMAALKNLIQS